MSAQAAMSEALEAAGLTAGIRRVRDLSGGCIHRVRELTLDDGRAVVVKITRARSVSLFEEEAASLAALAATETVLVPVPLVVGVFGGEGMIVLSALPTGRATDAAWRRFGRELAALHAAPAGQRYGLEMDNHLGTTRQVNTSCRDWVDFNARYRIGFQLSLADENRSLEPGEIERLECLVGALDRLLPRRPRPSLLHGDLWSGNALPTVDPDGAQRIAVIDPACSIGDGWADIAMMRLFGGFPPACFEAYDACAEDRDRIEQRIAVYQVYHLLNHVNLFGRGYVSQTMAALARLGL